MSDLHDLPENYDSWFPLVKEYYQELRAWNYAVTTSELYASNAQYQLVLLTKMGTLTVDQVNSFKREDLSSIASSVKNFQGIKSFRRFIESKLTRKYWALGFNSDYKDLESFKTNNIWHALHYKPEDKSKTAEDARKRFAQIKEGDYILIKGMGGRHDLKVHYAGIVKSKDENEKVLEFYPRKIDLYHGKAPKGTGAGIWYDTIVSVQRHVDIKRLFDTTPVNPHPDLTLSQMEQEKDILSPAIPLNYILYGPPGTGKTYELNQWKEEFTDYEAALSEEDLLERLAEEFPWWKLIAALLYNSGSMTVPELVSHPLINAKRNPDKPTKANQIVWSQLQLHTIHESKTVNHTRKHDPAIFDKAENSRWHVDKDIIDQDLTDVKELAEQIKNISQSEGKTTENRRYSFVTFHQSFTYEDFVEGLKPVLQADDTALQDSTEIGYRIEKGIFYRSCLKALKLAGYQSFTDCFQDSKEERQEKFQDAAPYALFIDEINRGNVSAIFGELITLIEQDKRMGADQEIWVNLPYDKNLPFAVPPNLYILGTMNTADRSVEALDTALRRRFAFKEVAPQPQLLSAPVLLWALWEKDWHYEWKDEKWINHEKSLLALLGGEVIDQKAYRLLGETEDREAGRTGNIFENIVTFNGLALDTLLTTINQRIALLIDQDQTIGHSYLLSVPGANDCEQVLLDTFYDKLIPLLKEYFYGDFGKIGLILGDQFVEKQPARSVKFASFKMDDQEIFWEKSTYQIIDYRLPELREDFLKAVTSIYQTTEQH